MKYLVCLTLFLTQMSFAQTPDVQGWTNESQLGIVSSNGNTRSESWLLKQGSAYKYERVGVKVTANYLKNSLQDNGTGILIESEKWDAGLRFDYSLNSRLAIFIGQNAESDKLSGIYRRYNTDLGGKYSLVKTDTFYTSAEFGYRFTEEEYSTGLPSKKYNFLRLYSETEKKWTPTFSSKLWLEYLPNLDSGQDYYMNGEASVSAAINSIFSLKTAYLAKYANQPKAPHKTDTLFLTSLVAKF